ncbi:MAG: RidA family protein [Thermodesulfobacteriota bacterium]
MKRIVIRTDKAPTAIGPYEQGIRVENLIFTSGQIPVDPVTQGIVLGDIKEQTKRVIENIRAVLETGGASLETVVKTTVYLKNISDFNEMNEVYERYFKENKPARSCVEVSALPKGVGIEMEAIGVAE